MAPDRQCRDRRRVSDAGPVQDGRAGSGGGEGAFRGGDAPGTGDVVRTSASCCGGRRKAKGNGLRGGKRSDDHEVSILIRFGGGDREGRAPSKVPTMIIRPPQQGHRGADEDVSASLSCWARERSMRSRARRAIGECADIARPRARRWRSGEALGQNVQENARMNSSSSGPAPRCDRPHMESSRSRGDSSMLRLTWLVDGRVNRMDMEARADKPRFSELIRQLS